MASNGLQIADGLSLPIDAVTETFLIFGKRGSGKTTAASVMTEELLGAGLPVCVIDPMGAWWGLRSSADGQGPGLPVMIIGGEHADLPLSPESGETIADLVVSERLPVVLDMFLMSKTKQKKFVTEFMERLFRKNREPLHLVIDEADRFAPQRGMGGTAGEDARLLGAYEDIVLRGRKPGIGSTSITLRPQNLHSAIRSQVEVLIAMRLLGKLEVAAIDEWIRLHATDEEARELKASLPSLPTGTAWVWSPGWLEMMRKIQIRPRLTFDSSATPKVGQQAITPREFARVSPADLERMGALLSAGAPEADAKPAARKGTPGPDAEPGQRGEHHGIGAVTEVGVEDVAVVACAQAQRLAMMTGRAAHRPPAILACLETEVRFARQHVPAEALGVTQQACHGVPARSFGILKDAPDDGVGGAGVRLGGWAPVPLDSSALVFCALAGRVVLVAVLVIEDLPDALAGKADLANDVDLLPAFVGSFPDGGKEAGVRRALALLRLSVRPREHAQVGSMDHA